MSWLPVVFAALLLMAVLYPFAAPFLARERRGRRAHRGGVVHWYPNYDESMQFEPRMERDIIPVTRSDLHGLGYRPGSEDAVVPRTFRHRVPGDVRFRLWTSPDESLRPLWICCWHGLELAGTGHAREGLTRLTRDMLLFDDRDQNSALDARAMPADAPESPVPVIPGAAATSAATDLREAARTEFSRAARRLAVVPAARTALRKRRSRTHTPRTGPSRARR